MKDREPFCDIVCDTHGWLAIVSQAVLGMAIINNHRKHAKEDCGDVKILPRTLNKDWSSFNINGKTETQARIR